MSLLAERFCVRLGGEGERNCEWSSLTFERYWVISDVTRLSLCRGYFGGLEKGGWQNYPPSRNKKNGVGLDRNQWRMFCVADSQVRDAKPLKLIKNFGPLGFMVCRYCSGNLQEFAFHSRSISRPLPSCGIQSLPIAHRSSASILALPRDGKLNSDSLAGLRHHH